MKQSKFVIVLLLVCILLTPVLFGKRHRKDRSKIKDQEELTEVLWANPGRIRSRDLRYGPGSRKLAPVAPFTFLKERTGGSSPKFEVTDARNVRWVVKLGPESQAETVAVRLVWTVGYFSEEAYYFDRVYRKGLPPLSKGERYVESSGVVRGARFEPRRKDVKRGEHWHWDKNPFVGTRELDGLKVLMILLNNFDARPENNHVVIMRNPRRKRMEARYVVTDLGATLGRARGIGEGPSKNNLEDYQAAKFVTGVKDGLVRFDYKTHPGGLGLLLILYPPYYVGEVKREKIMQGVPVANARWIGSLLSQLTYKQLNDAFVAAGYDAETRKAYVETVLERIAQLNSL